MNSPLARTSPRLASALLALVAVAALSPVVACGSDDDDTSGNGTSDSGTSGAGDSATSSGLDSGTGSGDATTGDSGTSGFDAATDSSTGSSDAGTDAALGDGAVSDADAASGACKPVNGVYTLTGPTSGSTPLICPTESGITCHFATESGSCELVTQCSSPDGGLGTGFFAIPSGTLDGNDRLSYSATYPVPYAGNLTASCALQFYSETSTVTLVCAGSIQGVGTLASCSYGGGLTDAGL